MQINIYAHFCYSKTNPYLFTDFIFTVIFMNTVVAWKGDENNQQQQWNSGKTERMMITTSTNNLYMRIIHLLFYNSRYVCVCVCK